MAQEVSIEEWRAHLADLKSATEVVRKQSKSISETMASIDSKMNEIADDWSSPAHGSFDDVKKWFHTVEHELETLLDDIVNRMDTSHRNYLDAESTNLNNLGDGNPTGV
ncbi:WXG100 family type VII secretion target [Streptomyces sp. P38-E01]|uniref:WXG100 family type VII secretion target n=1 Tax=Streptomyces tardus TaxID=2780544 RepID=A0A949JKF2_9ACTN|nr:WXG100 family type VII secretion target [Streptomyces tardus]MBU7600418.1 WXG100 family type VII secretion target [Streptomyces tardus]